MPTTQAQILDDELEFDDHVVAIDLDEDSAMLEGPGPARFGTRRRSQGVLAVFARLLY